MFSRRIFSENSYKTSYRKEVPCEVCTMFICIDFCNFRWNTKSKFLDFHTSESRGDKMSEFMNENNEEKYKYREEYTEENGHEIGV